MGALKRYPFQGQPELEFSGVKAHAGGGAGEPFISAIGGLLPWRCAAGPCCTTRLENAHGIEFREVFYRYHPWFGRDVGIHGVVAKSGGVYFRCAVAGGQGDRWLEVPAWMFERASCPGGLELTAAPFVSLDALAELSALLDRAMKTSTSSSNAPLSGASRSSHN